MDFSQMESEGDEMNFMANAPVIDVDMSESGSVDGDPIDKLNFGDVLSIEPPDYCQFQRLANKLGGLSINVYQYESMFGRVSTDHPFGEDIWHGLVRSLNGYPWMTKVWGTVPWLAFFLSPLDFSKSNAKKPMSAITKMSPDIVQYSYPTVVYLDEAQHGYLAWVIGNHKQGKSPQDMDFFDNVQLDGKTKLSDDEKLSDTWKTGNRTKCPFDSMVVGEVDLLCLKILIAGCRPWRVHSSWLRLYTPVSRL